MDEATRTDAASFDAIAAEYDAHRPSYPDALVDLACRRADVGPGSEVLEVGCGTGKLTAALLARGLRVTAVEPGAQLAALTRDKLDDGSGALMIQLARLEQAELPARSFAAAFSAAAFHWVDPDVGWARVAELLAPGGTFALLEHEGVDDAELGPDQELVLDTIRRHAPEWAARWPPLRTREQLVAEGEARAWNISELWSYLSGHALARQAAGALFAQAVLDVEPQVYQSSAAELNALLATMSFHARLSAEQVAGIEAANLAYERSVGRPLRSAGVAVLVTARVAA